MTVVLDTSIVSALMHRDPAAWARLRRESPGDIVLCAPVGAEIAYGLSRLAPGSRRRELLGAEYGRLRGAVEWADWTEAASGEFGRQKASLESAGTPLDDMDLAIASIAIQLRARLATANVRHFSRLAGLTVEDWTS